MHFIVLGKRILFEAFSRLLLSKLFEVVLATSNEAHALRADPKVPYGCPTLAPLLYRMAHPPLANPDWVLQLSVPVQQICLFLFPIVLKNPKPKRVVPTCLSLSTRIEQKSFRKKAQSDF
jgi:hypothetical protein